MPESVLEQLATRGLKVQESEQLAPVLGSSDVLYVTRVQKERFATEAEQLKRTCKRDAAQTSVSNICFRAQRALGRALGPRALSRSGV